jgi:hypothetical protein
LAWKKPAVAIEWNEEAYMDSASAVGVKAATTRNKSLVF